MWNASVWSCSSSGGKWPEDVHLRDDLGAVCGAVCGAFRAVNSGASVSCGESERLIRSHQHNEPQLSALRKAVSWHGPGQTTPPAAGGGGGGREEEYWDFLCLWVVFLKSNLKTCTGWKLPCTGPNKTAVEDKAVAPGLIRVTNNRMWSGAARWASIASTLRF